VNETIRFFDWKEEIEKVGMQSIGDDLILFDQPVLSSVLDHPVKVDVTTIIICRQGRCRGTVNLEPNEGEGPGLIILPRNSILQFKEISDDFSSLFIIMSESFLNSLNIEEKMPLWMSVRETPYIPVTEEELEALVIYYEMLKNAMRFEDNPYLLNTARHLTIAFFYGMGYSLHRKGLRDNKRTSSRSDVILERFLNQLRNEYRTHRSLNHYADVLCLSPKYLSKMITESSGKSPVQWIKEYVIHEAQALLTSSNLTIQQISDELNFPSQSFFGKYFKRYTGVSPKNYRSQEFR